MLTRKLIALAGLIIALPSFALPPTSAKILNVDLRDVVTYVNQAEFPEAHLVVDSFRKEPSRWFPEGVTFDEKVYGAELSAIPEKDGATTVLMVNAFMQYEAGKFGFRKFKLNVDPVQKKVLKSEIVEKMIPLEDTDFRVTAGLIDRMVLVEDAAHDIRKLYPIGVGGFDLGVVTPGRNRLMTPVFTGAFISKANTNPSRTDPDYYKGLPFIAISNSKRQRTPYAFHTTQGDRERVGGKEIERMRGFWSHGCMRLRDRNLKELFNIVWYNGGKEIPVNVAKATGSSLEHPYPRTETRYNSVKNFGTRSKPETRRDEHDLTIMEIVNSKPPVELLASYAYARGDELSMFFNGDDMSISEMEAVSGEHVQEMPMDSNPHYEWVPSQKRYDLNLAE